MKSRMQPMSISMGKDYESTLQERRESYHRKAIVATLLTCVSLVLSYVIMGSRKATAAHHSTSICRSYNAAYFKGLATQIEHHAINESHLCITDIITNNSKCGCKNPYVPVPQENKIMAKENWLEIMRMNTRLLRQNYSDHDKQPDVLLYGDSITERLLGRFFGRYGPKMQEYTRVMEQVFTKEGGGQVDGLPLGISSDQIPHLLYRMIHGELPEFLHPQVWWILIGANDLAVGCSGDVIVAGVIRLVQEIKQHLHDHHAHRGEAGKHAPIVINSILPRSRGNLLPEVKSNSNKNNKFWKVSQDINLRLYCYANITNDVSFANTTDMFVHEETQEFDGRDGVFIDPDMFEKDNLHPSVKGSRRWEEYIVDKIFSLVMQ